tara:strand:+ start:1095 stop:1841 length:747 start_codon:yes stop_codon:yes gene_type:complete
MGGIVKDLCRRSLLAACVVSSCSTLSCSSNPAAAEALIREVADPDPFRYDADIAAFTTWDRKNSTPDDAVLFVGSSSIRFWPTAVYFSNRKVVNRGFGGAHISDVNHFVQETVFSHDPSVVVFYAGDNDVWAGKREAQILDDFVEFVSAVQAESTNTPIVFVSLKPSPSRWSVWAEMQAANQTIRSLVDGDPFLHYADVATPMIGNDGVPIPGLFLDDGLHLNAEGYGVWTDVVKTVLLAAIGDSDGG